MHVWLGRACLAVSLALAAVTGAEIVGTAGAGASSFDQVMVWGSLGHATTYVSSPAPDVSGVPPEVTGIDAEDGFTYAWDASGIWAWGDGTLGALGDGTFTSSPTRAVQVRGLPPYLRVEQVQGGDYFGLALLSDGSVWWWGNIEGGPTDVASQVSGLSDVVSVSAGDLHSLALLADGQVAAWGSPHFGDLCSQPPAATRYEAPTVISSLTDVTAVSAGDSTSLFLTGSGTVYACGRNEHGQLGIGDLTDAWSPTPVVGLSGVTAISAGGNLTTDGESAALVGSSLYVWGDNADGELCRGNTTPSDVPELVTGIPPVSQVSAGGAQTLFTDDNGDVYGCGDNKQGQVGDGTFVNALSPVEVLRGADQISAGASQSVALASQFGPG